MLFFKNLVVLKPKEKHLLDKNIHEEIGHFSERKTLAEVKKRFFWHDKIEFVRTMVRQCQRCQLAKSSGSIRSDIEEMKTFLFVTFSTGWHWILWDLFLKLKMEIGMLWLP